METEDSRKKLEYVEGLALRMGGQGVVLAAEAFEPDHFELPGREQGETATPAAARSHENFSRM